MRPGFLLARQLIRLAVVLAAAFPPYAAAQFNFNFGPSGAPVVPSIANQACGGAGGGMGAGGMGGCADGTPFFQQIVTIGGANYYHVVVGDGTGEFGIESYVQTVGGGVCWFGCAGARVAGGMGGMGGMGGPAPLSASSGSATNDSAPLASGNSGTGRPDRAAIRQFNNTTEMSQEFLKATISQKPRITQSVNSADMTLDFAIDMTNSNYNQSVAGSLSLTQSITSDFPAPGNNPNDGTPFPDSANFDVNNLGPGSNVNISGGRFTYSPGGGDGGSLGAYSYFADAFDVYNVDWTSFCDPAQNPTSNCVNYGGVRGGMGAGGMGGAAGGGAGGMGGGATGGGATGGGATGGGATMGGGTTGGGMGGGTTGGGTTGGGMGGAATTSTTVTTTTTTTTVGGVGTSTTVFTTTSTSTTTTIAGTSASGGGMGGR